MTHLTRATIAKIHIAKADLALDDAAYRALLQRVTGHTSSKQCTPAQLGAVLEEFRRLGWKPANPWAFIDQAPAERQPLLRKIAAIAGTRGPRYVEGIARRMFNVQRLQWCEPEQLHKIVAALNIQARRADKPSGARGG